MLCRRLLVLLVLVLSCSTAFGWGKKGHDIICYIAECHLSDAALERVSEVLDGRSMVYYSSWADQVKYEGEFSYTREWHYFSMEHKDSAASARRSKGGDVLSAVEAIVSELKGGDLTAEDEAVALKLLIHLVGDMHQPMHLGRYDDGGGSDIPVVYFVESTSLHAAWDYHIVMGCREWSYTEWQQQIDRVSEVEEAVIVGGSYADWIDATHDITVQLYRDTPPETRIHYKYVAKYTPVVEQQLLYAALRLAHILNDIYV